MPKIVDHEVRRQELAAQAATLFSAYGYSALGMRQIAAELGISKSSLYHYFPNKRALFHACTDVVTQIDLPEVASGEYDGQTDLPQFGVDGLMAMAQAMEPGFAAEMSLLLDYLRDKTPEQIGDDPTMQLASRRYEATISSLVSAQHVQPALCMLLGVLLLRHFNGGATSFEQIEAWMSKAVIAADV